MDEKRCTENHLHSPFCTPGVNNQVANKSVLKFTISNEAETKQTMKHLTLATGLYYHRHHRQNKLAVFVIVFQSILLQVQNKPLLTDGAVVRPTIFSDLPSEAANHLEPAQQSGQQQQQQLQQQQQHKQLGRLFGVLV